MSSVRGVGFALLLAVWTCQACGRRAPSGEPATADRAGIAQPQRETGGEAPRAAETPPPAEGGGRVENANSVTRYDDETTLGHAGATLVKSAFAHTAAEDGHQVTLLVGGTDVVQIAERGRAILVMFPDPAESTKQEMGWISASALRPARRGRCPHRQVAIDTVLGSICARPCSDAGDCRAAESCVQSGTAAEYAGRITDSLLYCIAK